jgi:1,4-dihydroxy-2-naphthoate octaprenyltransferase
MTTKSTVTCDMEGRIETYSKGAEEIFGYSPDEVVGRKRVSLFSPGLVVLQNVPGWLAEADDEGAYEGRTVFLKKDGTPFAADIRITPTFKDGERLGYCGVTTPRPDVPVAEAMPKISPLTKAFAGLVVTRAPFLSATVIPLLVAAGFVLKDTGFAAFSWGLFGLTVVAACALHIAANTLNDYFDHRSGVDEANNNYFLPFSGGSRAIELGLIEPRQLVVIASIALLLSSAIGVYLAAVSTPLIYALGAVGAFAAVFYTAPPLKLVARKGLGELFIGLCFGPLMVLGGLAVLTGGIADGLVATSLWLGLPVGLLTTAILWINEFPDFESDKATGKTNLVVALGKPAARHGYLALLLVSFALPAMGVALGALPVGALLALLSLPIAIFTTRMIYTRFEDRELIAGNKWTIILQGLFGFLLAVGLLLPVG